MKQKHTYIANEENYYLKAQAKREIERDCDSREQTVRFLKDTIVKPISILEIGCGISDIFNFLPRNFQYYGIDPSEFAVKKLKEQNHDLNLSVGYAENLPFRDQQFGAVFSFQVLEHLFDPRQALQEMIRVIKPGGYVIVSAPNLECPWSMPNAVRHYPHFKKIVLMAQRFGDLFMRNFEILKFRMIKQNYTQWSGKFEKSDDDLTHLTSAYEVATFLKRNGCQFVFSREPKRGLGLKNFLKKIIRKMSILQYYDSGIYLIFQKTY